MKGFIRGILLNTFSLFLVGTFYPGIVVPQALDKLLVLGLVFTLINKLVKPIIKLFLLPLNLVTLGLFRWVSNVLILVIITKMAPEIQIVSFTTSAVNTSGFVIPALNVNLVFSFIVGSLLIGFVFELLTKFLVTE
jgi:putative membrane protein